MPSDTVTSRIVGDQAAPYLCSFSGVVALEIAIKIGLIDQLASEKRPAIPPVLTGLLQATGVIALDGLALTEKFAEVWHLQAADLTARVRFLRQAAADVACHGEALFLNTDAFMQVSSTFEMFDYKAALHHSPTAIAATRHWVEYVSALTRAEGAAVLAHLPLPSHGLILELGGNSGAFARMILAVYPDLSHVILDLANVCLIGAETPANVDFGPRLRFVAGDMRRDDLQGIAGQPPDVILFKSVLHDWPEDEAEALLARAVAAVAKGGRILIAERSAYACGLNTPTDFIDCGNLVFSGFYRDPDFYAAALRRHAPQARITIDRFTLDMGWAVTMADLS